jgi:hypothetical protein
MPHWYVDWLIPKLVPLAFTGRGRWASIHSSQVKCLTLRQRSVEERWTGVGNGIRAIAEPACQADGN